VIFIEHKALYNTFGPVPDVERVVPIGPDAITRSGTDATIVANSRIVLAAEEVSIEAVDLRALRPLDTATVLSSVRKVNRAVVVNEGWRTSGFGAEISALIAEEAFDCLDAPVARNLL